MKIASFKAGPTATYGLVTNAGIIDAGKRLKAHPTLKSLLENGSLDALKALQSERPDYAFAEIELLPTVPDPDKIFCIGVNYATHLAESGHPPHPAAPDDLHPLCQQPGRQRPADDPAAGVRALRL